jgi:hypothetical protein
MLFSGLHDDQKADLNGSQPKKTTDQAYSIHGIVHLHDRIEDEVEDGIGRFAKGWLPCDASKQTDGRSMGSGGMDGPMGKALTLFRAQVLDS